MSFGARRWLVVLGVWSGVAAFSVAHIYVARAALGHPPPLVPLLTLELPVWLFWALVSVPVVMLARRFPLDRRRVTQSVLLHGVAGVGIAVLAVGFQMLWYQGFNPYPLGGTSVSAWFWQYFRQYFMIGFVIYWAVVGVYHAFANYFLYEEQEGAASRARAQLTEARLDALVTQLRPHFLFNALNSVSSLVESEPHRARQVLAQLGDLLRATLRADARHEVTLGDEMRVLDRYLAIERVRFGDRMSVSTQVEPGTERAAVPSFILQPLVENALRHGIAQRESSGRLWLRARRRNGTLVLHVADDGPGLDRGPHREGIGLANTRRRLRELYGEEHVLALDPRPGGGVDVRVEIPFRTLEGDR